MHIFIDEAGPFAGISQFPSPSVVGALVIPDHKVELVTKKYSKLRVALPKEKGEVKGRLLDEWQISMVVNLLRRNMTLFEASVIELGIHTKEDILWHKGQQEEAFTRNLTEEHNPKLVEGVWKYRRQLESMSIPLYVQSVLNTELIYRVIQNGCLYYSQRCPRELENFHWIIDSKSNNDFKTPWEQWWSHVVMPHLQSRSLREPFCQFTEGDYSYFERFKTEPSDYLRQFVVTDAELTDHPIGLNEILGESIRFSSQSEWGLELVDIVTNALRRAVNGNLRKSGWIDIPRLMIHRPEQYMKFCALMNHEPPKVTYPYAEILRYFKQSGRSMLAPRFSNSQD